MKKFGILLVCIFLFSCQSDEEKQQLTLERLQKEEFSQKIEQKKQSILDKKKEKQRLLREQKNSEEEAFKQDLLSDSLLQDTELLNKQALALLEKKEPEKFIAGVYDLESDDSITKYVNNEIAFTKLDYIPNDLVGIKSDYINDVKGNSQLRKEASEALENLAQNFHLQFSIPLKVVSAYRSYEYQKGIKERGCSDSLCANPGHSEHQSGLAVDFWETSTLVRFVENENLKLYFEWMNTHAASHGFTNTYQKGIEVDGYLEEPWHWRYVGIPLAQTLKEYDITFAQYYKEPENY